MLEPYKNHIWGTSEYSNGAIILASHAQLRRLDKMQRWFLHELDITDTDAFLNFNFAPPSLRRRIGLLGFLHKRCLNTCHPLLCELLPWDTGTQYRYNTKTLEAFFDRVSEHANLYDRSLYLYVLMYNRLPQSLVDSPSTPVFQARLTHLTKQRAARGDRTWRDAFQDCLEVVNQFYGPNAHA